MMKKKAARISSVLKAEPSSQFVRGFVATGLLAALPGPAQVAPGKKALHLALRGGIAIAAGTGASNALQQQRYSTAILSIAAGVCGLALTDRAFNSQESQQEEE